MRWLTIVLLILLIAGAAFGLEHTAFQMREDFSTEGIYDGALQYYYYIPCPTYSWFWAYTGWVPGDYVGSYFTIGDQGTGGWFPLDPLNCTSLEQIRVLDFAGYGTLYPGHFTVEMDVWCPPCPLYHLGGTGPVELHFGWNYVPLDVCVYDCFDGSGITFVVTMKMVGVDGGYPAVGCDNISTAIETGCDMHDIGCLPATYPRASVNSGYFGCDDVCRYDPPIWFCDGRDTTPDCSQYGPIELAWRAYITCAGPSSTNPSTWGNIKSVYR